MLPRNIWKVSLEDSVRWEAGRKEGKLGGGGGGGGGGGNNPGVHGGK